ncbi:MAG: type II toxin-antitoxin system HigB family toxin [Pirellulales bacterium]
MRVISKSRLRQFWELAGSEDSEGPLRAWYTHVSNRTVDWNTWADVKAEFASASHVGNCVVFNIHGNKYRLITRVLYATHTVYVLRVMTHGEYDEDKWTDECGCFEPPPKKKTAKKIVQKKKFARRATRRK